jgi:hypothetical protein
MVKSKRILYVALVVVAFTALTLPRVAYGEHTGSQAYIFTNSTGKHASDLHIHFNKGVFWDTGDTEYKWQNPKGTFTNNKGSGTNTTDHADGTGVDNGNSVTLTLQYDGTIPTVSSYEWTFNIPTLSQWGLIIMAGLLLTVGAVVIRRRLKAVSA